MDVVHTVSFLLSLRHTAGVGGAHRCTVVCQQLLAAMALVSGPWEAVTDFLRSAADGSTPLASPDDAPCAAKPSLIPDTPAPADAAQASAGALTMLEPDPGPDPVSVTAFLDAFRGECATFSPSLGGFDPLKELHNWGLPSGTTVEGTEAFLAFLHWPSLLSPCPLPPALVAALVGRRHELCEWAYPPLTDEQKVAGCKLTEVRTSNDAGRKCTLRVCMCVCVCVCVCKHVVVCALCLPRHWNCSAPHFPWKKLPRQSSSAGVFTRC